MIRLSCAALLLTAAPALAQDVSYELVNQTGLTLMEFYASPAASGEWGDDILGAEVVAPGESGTVTIAGGSDQCLYDFRSVFEDGTDLEEQHDICTAASYTLSQ
jgi:hypothetical protein